MLQIFRNVFFVGKGKIDTCQHHNCINFRNVSNQKLINASISLYWLQIFIGLLFIFQNGKKRYGTPVAYLIVTLSNAFFRLRFLVNFMINVIYSLDIHSNM